MPGEVDPTRILTIMGGPTHGLRAIPTRERVCREARMYQSEMRAIEDMVQVVIVVVHLRRRKLALVDDILGRERTDVEAL